MKGLPGVRNGMRWRSVSPGGTPDEAFRFAVVIRPAMRQNLCAVVACLEWRLRIIERYEIAAAKEDN